MIAQDTPLQTSIRCYVALTLEKRQLQERLSEIERELEALNTPLVDGLLDEGIEHQRISLDGASYTVYPQTRLFARPAGGDMQALCDAIRDHGGMLGAAVHETVNLQTLSAWVREREREGGVPEEIKEHLAITQTPQLQVRRAGH